jgi:uncharacterized GH25 family protein
MSVLFNLVTAMIVAGQANAHFLWLKSDAPGGKPQAVLIFGESAADEAYHLPESLADVAIWCRTPDGKRAELETKKVENDDRIGLVAPLPSARRPQVLEATRDYGVYGDFLLTYDTKHILADSNDELAVIGPSPQLKLEILPEATGKCLELTVLWDGKPKADIDVNVKVDGENEDIEAQKLKTDADGKVRVQPEGNGLVAVSANVHDGSQSGELDGKKYTSAAHYATLTFPWQQTSRESKAEHPAPKESVDDQSGIPPLLEPVSSFGAAVADGYLYVYSGHTGTEHDHSAANLSQHFCRVALAGDKDWEQLPMEMPLQGLALVAHGGKLYRVGGMNARNATTDDKEDLHSTTEFAAYDPATKKWTSLAPLPAPRSSHNAVVIGERLYVTGGWTLNGSRKGEWLDDSLVYDFSDPSAGWQKLPKQDFQRRALAASQWQGKFAAMGGMDENAKVSRRVDFFDPASGKWSRGPDLPGAGMSGFGVSAWSLDENLYVSGFNGRVFKLANDGSKWQEVAKLDHTRFFHQLVPAATPGALLVVGGASRDGHLDDVELVDVSGTAQVERERPAGDKKGSHAENAKRAIGKTAVLLVSHGSPSPQWRQMLLDLEQDVEEEVLALPGITGLRSAFMEYSEPAVATQLKALDEEGFENVILIPLLLTVSSHSFDDIPTILGLKDDAASLAFLKSEGIERYRPKARVTITPLLDFSALLEKNLPRRIARLSKRPTEEGVVLVAYGSKPYNEEWTSFFDEMGAVVRRKTGAALVTHCWCGDIVDYQSQPIADAIRNVLAQTRRAIVVPVLVSYDQNFQGRIIGGAVEQVSEPDRVAYVPDAILPDHALNEWIVSISRQTYDALCTE